MDKKNLEKLGQIKEALKQDKTIFLNKWKELSPYLGISFSNWDSSTPYGEKLADTKPIFDSTADEAGDIMANGIQGYACGASSPWFSLSFEDEKNQKSQALGGALKASEDRLYRQFSKSSFYDASMAMVQSVIHLATAIMWMEEDPTREQPTFTVLHPRDCYIQENAAHEVDVLFRDFWLTQEEAVNEFGDELSPEIKNCKTPTEKFQFTNYVGPRSKFGMADQVRGKKDYISVYWETGKTTKTVKEEEYSRKPFAVWRYNRALFGGAWGVDSPGMKMLSNIKQVNGLCEDRSRLSQLTAEPYGKKTRGLKVNITPNGFTELGSGEDFTVMQPTNNLSWTQQIITDLQKRIRSAYYADYFLILSSTIEQRKTATEAQGLQEEKSVIMASFFSRMGSEFFEPVIEWTFMNEALHGRLPELAAAAATSDEMIGADIRVDFVSQLAKTQQRAAKYQPNLQYANQIMQLMQVFPEARFKLDIYNYLDDVAKSFGTNENMVISTSKAKQNYAALVQAQLQQAQAQNQMNALEQAGKAYKDAAAGEESMKAANSNGGR